MRLAIRGMGLVTPVGLSAPAACAGIRAGLTNPTETGFVCPEAEAIVAHQVPLQSPCRGLEKLTCMASLAVSECLESLPREEWSGIPLLLCTAETGRPGRIPGLDTGLFAAIQQTLGAEPPQHSQVIAQGRTSVALALQRARDLIAGGAVRQVIVAAADSLISWPTLRAYLRERRLLTPKNSNGFIPGEGAGALLLGGSPSPQDVTLTGLGFGVESAHINSGGPLRATGLTEAIREALADARLEVHEVDYRIADVNGEQYYFKEAALALNRILRSRKDGFEIWHPAQSCGESGAVAGVICIALACAAFLRGYAPGPRALLHLSADHGERAAAILEMEPPRG